MYDLEYTEEIATLTYRSTTHRILIGPIRQTGQWAMLYLLDGQDVHNPQATCYEGKNREDIIKRATHFMCGHGRPN
jgi:hypothetical protein